MKNFYSQFSLAMKILLPVVVILGCLSFLIYLYFPSQIQKEGYERFAQQARQLSDLNVNQLPRKPTGKNNTSIQEFAETIGRTEGVLYVVITGDGGEILGAFHLKDAQIYTYQDTEWTGTAAIKTMRVIVDNRKVVGRLYIGLSLEQLQGEIIQYKSDIALKCVILFISGVLIILVVVLTVTSPLRKILSVVQHAASGNYAERLIPASNDELGKLAHAINSLLKNSDATHQQVGNLTRIIENREQQLRDESSQRTRVEKQIQLTDEIINKVSALITVMDGEGDIVYASPSFEHVMGYKPEDLLNDGWWKIMKPDFVERMKERNKIAKCARGEHPLSGVLFERQVIDSSGNIRWILWQDTRGFNNTLIGVGQDITGRKLAEERIREQAALLDITSDAIMVRNLDQRVLFWNVGAELLYNVPSKEALGKIASELFQEENATGIGLAYSNVIESGYWKGELKQMTLSGKILTVESRWTLMNDELGKPKSILVVNTDVTEQRQLESQFRRAQRLENIGTLAGGIAHDLNNVLTPILMSIQALDKWHTDERTKQLVSTIDSSARRGADIVKQVLTFARGSEGERTLLQPKHFLREIEKIVRETFARSLDIRSEISSNLWTIIGDTTQLHQIALNLLVNARDAMPNGGTLTLKAENTILDDQGARKFINAKPGKYVVISVKDSGTGIPPEIMDKIFDPFFTTKEVGKGTGLGLSTVTSIVKSYGGFIVIESKVGEGTEFRVHIPATNVELSQQLLEKKTQLPTGRGESILVVDDELSIREITKSTLEAYGYRVQTAKDGIEALTMIEKDPHKYALVITDMMMPNMDGGSMIRTLGRLVPDIKIIAISGITDPEVLEKIKKSHIEAFLPKPIQADNLLKILDQALHSEELEVQTDGKRKSQKH